MTTYKKGLTLIETLLAGTLLSGTVAAGINYAIGYAADLNNLSNASFPLDIIKAVDQRIKIDGYTNEGWKNLPLMTTTELETSSFVEKAFTSRNHPSCGASDGWLPNKEEAAQISLLPCNYKNKKSGRYDSFIYRTSNNIEMITSIDIVQRLKSKHPMIEKENGLKHKELLNEIKSNKPIIENGLFQSGFYNFLDLSKELTFSECLLLKNNCVIKSSWLSEGYSEGVRLDGTNNIIDSTISFSKDYRASPYECLLWEYDDLGNYNLKTDVNCGVGIYKNTLRPSLVTIDTATSTINFGSDASPSIGLDDAILLDKMCNNFSQRSDGFIENSGTTECGLFKNNNGLNTIVQVVDKLDIDPNYINSRISLDVSELIAEETNATHLEVRKNLEVVDANSETSMNIIMVQSKDSTDPVPLIVLNGLVEMENLLVETKSDFKSNVTVTTSDQNLIDALVVLENVNLKNSSETSIVEEDLITENVVVGNLKLNPTLIADGAACLFSQEGEMHFTGNSLLMCKKSGVAGVFKWLSDKVGRVSAFTGNCPSGWTELNDSKGRAIIGSGHIFDPYFGTLKYNVGETGGKATVRLTIAEMPSHSHDYKDAWFSERWMNGPGRQQGSGDSDNDNNLYERNMTTELKGGDQSHENRMAYTTIKYCQYKTGDGQTSGSTDPNVNPDDYWYPYPSSITDWYSVGLGYDCSADDYQDLRPDSEEFWIRDCKQDYERTISEREINYITGVVRLTGLGSTETKTEKSNEIWTRGTPTYTDWIDISAPYDCSYPAVDEKDRGSYWELLLSCKVQRERFRQERIMLSDSDGNALSYRDLDNPVRETNEFVDNYTYFIDDSDTYKYCGDWDITAMENAKVWSPDAANYDRTQKVNQSRVVEQFRDCETRTDFMTHTYTLNEFKEYRDKTQTRTINGSKINLKTWLTYDTNGIWSTSSDGSYAYQAKNGAPTIFETPTKDYGKEEGSVFRGELSVGNDGDDDYIGFVMGKKNTKEFYLWSWKKGDQNGGKAGHTFAKVTGGVASIGWDTHVSRTGYTALASSLGKSKGWTWNKRYEFRIEYKRDNIRIFIDGKLLFDIDGAYPEGGVGFYNNSQSKVSYYEISEEPYYE